jgi:hypothetical protein
MEYDAPSGHYVGRKMLLWNMMPHRGIMWVGKCYYGI